MSDFSLYNYLLNNYFSPACENIPDVKTQPINNMDPTVDVYTDYIDSVNALGLDGARPLDPSLVKSLNFLQLERKAPFLLCVLIKAAGSHLHTSEGKKLFKELCKKATTNTCLHALVENGEYHNFFAHLALGCDQIFSDAQAKFACFQEDVAVHYLTQLLGKTVASDALEKKDKQAFQTAMLSFLKSLKRDHEKNPLKKAHFLDLCYRLENFDKRHYFWTENIFIECYQLFKAEEFYDSFTKAIDQAVTKKTELERVHQVATLCLKDRCNLPLPTPISSGQVGGSITRTFTKLDNEQGGYHVWCGCLVKASGLKKHFHLPPPELSDIRQRYEKLLFDGGEGSLKGKSVQSISFNLGGGHLIPQEALAKRIALEGGHVHLADGAEEVLLHNIDTMVLPLAKMMGKETTLLECLRYLQRNEYWNIIKIIAKIYGVESEEGILQKSGLFAGFLLEQGADLGLASYTRHLLPFTQGCNMVGVPTYESATDFDNGFDTGDIDSGKFPHAAIGLYDDKKGTKDYLKGNIDPTKLLNGGLPVLDPFLKSYSRQDIADLKNKYKIDKDALVVMIMGGAEGQPSEYLEWVTKSYLEKKGPPKLHIIMVNGRNEIERKRHASELKRFGMQEKEKISIDTFEASVFNSGYLSVYNAGWVHGHYVAEIMAMTRFQAKEREGFVLGLKAGGSTSSQIAAAGARFLVKDMKESSISWEAHNIKALQERGLCETFPIYPNWISFTGFHSRQAEFTDEFFKMLGKKGPEKRPYDGVDSKGLFFKALTRVFKDAENDSDFQDRRKEAHKMIRTFAKV